MASSRPPHEDRSPGREPMSRDTWIGVDTYPAAVVTVWSCVRGAGLARFSFPLASADPAGQTEDAWRPSANHPIPADSEPALGHVRLALTRAGGRTDAVSRFLQDGDGPCE